MLLGVQKIIFYSETSYLLLEVQRKYLNFTLNSSY